MQPLRKCRSDGYNWNFDRTTGRFERWGKTKEDDPPYSKIGPEIADIEITTICDGINGTPCKFCYKSNTKEGRYMTFETFKRLFHKLPSNLTQIAFGVDAKCESNPDTFKIMEYCRINDVIPNVTVANVSSYVADRLTKLCGAVAVSRYDSIIFYESIKRLRKVNQLNVHILLTEETIPLIKDTYDAYINGVLNVHAIVGLSLKPKGRGKSMTRLSHRHFTELTSYALSNNIPIGFDSCTASKFIQACKDIELDFKDIIPYVEPCESSLFSIYINVNGDFYPCSFLESGKGISVLAVNDFLDDIWFNKDVVEFRHKLLSNTDANGLRMCPKYNI